MELSLTYFLFFLKRTAWYHRYNFQRIL